ncbi:hypothetical protein P9112_001366 [Eukaryota sp. TZLM1-RC]
MPVTDSDSDTDWNAQVKVLPVRSSSSPSLLHSPHPPSYARNSSQTNSNSKNDQCAAKNTKLLKNVPRCSSCHQLGHKKNSKKCENYQNPSTSYSVTAAAAELNNLEFNLPPKHECTAEDNDAVMLDIPLEASQIDNCAICNEKAERYILKNNLYVCHVCSSLDTLRPPCKIPNVLSPKASVSFSVAFRTFSLALKKGEWDVFSIWKFFLEQKSGSRPQKVYHLEKRLVHQ